MKYPCLVPYCALNNEITITLSEEDLNSDGELLQGEPLTTKCNLQLNAYDVFTSDKRKITLSGKALIRGDIAPDKDIITSGTVIFRNVSFTIYKGQKNYNPDGTVNYTTLELQ